MQVTRKDVMGPKEVPTSTFAGRAWRFSSTAQTAAAHEAGPRRPNRPAGACAGLRVLPRRLRRVLLHGQVCHPQVVQQIVEN
jgi:hypothetical protein